MRICRRSSFVHCFAIAGCFDGGGECHARPSADLAVGRSKKPAGQGSPGSATLSWYPPTENADGSYLDDLAGYRIYYGTNAKSLDLSITIDNPGLTRYVIENLSPAMWHFVMTSVNAKGAESSRRRP